MCILVRNVKTNYTFLLKDEQASDNVSITDTFKKFIETIKISY